jgi:lipoprotein-anchoring transpeptidase ErfK/SrfK
MRNSMLSKAVLLASSLAILAPSVADAQVKRFFDPVTRQYIEFQQAAMPRRVTVPEEFHRQVVAFETREAPGTIVVDTVARHLYFVLEGGRAIRYGIGVGREGFTWSGTVRVGNKAEWPDWRPPAEMLQRQPHLPTFMAGGPGNPLGARALYLHDNGRDTMFRIHGTNEPWTIGQNVSSGCIRMMNQDIVELYEMAKVGAKVIVL